MRQRFSRGKRDAPRDPDDKRRTTNRRTAIVLLAAAIPLLIGLYAVALVWSRPVEHGQQMSLSRFFSAIHAGEISDVAILDQDRRIIGESEDGPFWMAFGSSETILSQIFATLQGSDVPFTIRQQWAKSLVVPLTMLIPALLVVDALVLIFLIVRGRGDSLFGFGRAGARRADAGSKVTFSEVAGHHEAVEELAEIRDYLSNPERFIAMGATVPKGILLSGPPGCGKTLLARAIAGEAGVPFYSISGADFVEMFVGVGAARIRDLFRTAKTHSPCIVFIDELDAVGRGRASGGALSQDERETTLNQLLVEMDGFEMSTGVVVLAATNRPDVLDPALLRPGRFDRRITIGRPDVRGRLGILQIHARGKPLAEDADLELVAKRTPGFSGADLANAVNEAALLAARRSRRDIGRTELLEAVERVIAGPERRTRILSDRDRKLIAHHEAGHAVVSAAVPGADVVHKISIVSRDQAGGLTWFLPQEELVFAARSELTDRLTVLLAGRAAEQLFTGEPSTGARDDLERATRLARHMITDLGMGETFGPVSLNGATAEDPLGVAWSRALIDDVDAEVRKLLKDALARAKSLLERHRDVWHSLAAKLLEHESLEGSDLDLALEGVGPDAPTTESGRRLVR